MVGVETEIRTSNLLKTHPDSFHCIRQLEGEKLDGNKNQIAGNKGKVKYILNLQVDTWVCSSLKFINKIISFL
jgi:hypothetical protein